MDRERQAMEAVRDRLMTAMRYAPTAFVGDLSLAAHLAAVLKCLRDDTPAARVGWFGVLLAADSAVDDQQSRRALVLPASVAYVSAAELAFYAALAEQFPDYDDTALRTAAALKALTMSDTELIVLLNEDIDF